MPLSRSTVVSAEFGDQFVRISQVLSKFRSVKSPDGSWRFTGLSIELMEKATHLFGVMSKVGHGLDHANRSDKEWRRGGSAGDA
jgi:hypothetical protein